MHQDNRRLWIPALLLVGLIANYSPPPDDEVPMLRKKSPLPKLQRHAEHDKLADQSTRAGREASTKEQHWERLSTDEEE